MRKIWLLARNDLRLTTRDRTSVVWLALFPVAMMWFFGQIGGGSGSSEPPRIALTVVDQDRGWLSEAFVDELRDESINLTEMTVEKAATAEDKVRTLVIPAGFTDQVLAVERRHGDSGPVETPLVEMLLRQPQCGHDVFGRHVLAGFDQRLVC